MAGLTIGEAGVIEVRRLPRAGGVTLTALAREVIGRRVDGMTRLAVCEAGVIEVGRRPATGVVTRAALTREVIGRLIGRVA